MQEKKSISSQEAFFNDKSKGEEGEKREGEEKARAVSFSWA